MMRSCNPVSSSSLETTREIGTDQGSEENQERRKKGNHLDLGMMKL